MSYGSTRTSETLTLTSSFVTLKTNDSPTQDLETPLNPGESAYVQLKFDPKSSPVDDCEWRVITSPDQSNYDTTAWISGTIDKGTDPNSVAVEVRGCRFFKVQARTINPNGTAGSDSGSTVLMVVFTNGISL